MKDLLISFYGDDFTGSTDAMETLALAGLRTVLFTQVPTTEQLAKYPDLRTFGVAGMTRSMPADQMEQVLRPAFAAMRELGAPIVHYKVCSTFDSSQTIGSIGRVIDVGSDIFKQRTIPVLVAAPALGRYQVFGNLFARCGTESEPYRIDRHPSISRHPITPMDEADLRMHLAKQTSKRIELLNILQLNASPQETFESLVDGGAEVVLIDLLYQEQQAIAGEVLVKHAFLVGSSGVTAALCAHWQNQGVAKTVTRFEAAKSDGPIVAVCGSCSVVTANQIKWATTNGFVGIPMSDGPAPALRAIEQNRSVIVHSQREKTGGTEPIGETLGRILREILAASRVRRVLVAGGDTSGQVAHALGIESMEMIAELTRGSPLCRATAPGSPADGIEITFKGGQIGPVDFFGKVAG